MGSYKATNGWAIKWAYPRHTMSFLTLKLGVEKSLFQIAPKRLEIDENVNRARWIRHFLALSDAMNNRTAFAIDPNV